ncbi:PPK2 family polyphosphate kinase [Arcanobacterium ihumii]|uniref:PPK2 family polyphosphate kinase n=1 Tax=Arcanobacterium ihumii TaxID=2138162 RepID=UPI000F51B9ED|nr:PPK2 family polyphosphate kinase [Arcanobacterium ihumii]
MAKKSSKNHKDATRESKVTSTQPGKGWVQSPNETLRVSTDFDLANFDHASTPGWDEGKVAAEEFLESRGNVLSELQERFFAAGKFGDQRSVLLVVQGLDTAGKGGIARHVLGLVDPQGISLASFGVPTKEEASHHFLWRIRRALPKPGKIGLFDRSHYEDVLVQRVEKIVDEPTWRKRYGEINRFEKKLTENGVTIIKVALMVSHEEQGRRLAERIVRPDKKWKYNPNDIDTRLKWDEYQQAYQDVFIETSTQWAPWHIIPADHKWYARLAVTELLTQALIDFDLEWPKPRWVEDVQYRRLQETMTESETLEVNELRDVVVKEAAQAIESFDDEVATIDSSPTTSLTELTESPKPKETHDPQEVQDGEAPTGRTTGQDASKDEKKAKKKDPKKDKKSKKSKKDGKKKKKDK